jgi:hypothetical protein
MRACSAGRNCQFNRDPKDAAEKPIRAATVPNCIKQSRAFDRCEPSFSAASAGERGAGRRLMIDAGSIR